MNHTFFDIMTGEENDVHIQHYRLYYNIIKTIETIFFNY